MSKIMYKGKEYAGINFGDSPVGTIAGYGGQVEPDGWFICNGRELSREIYADLFSAIGTTYGTGDGSTTFNIPDLRGRTVVGASSGHPIGEEGGEETHTLIESELPVIDGYWQIHGAENGTIFYTTNGHATGTLTQGKFKNAGSQLNGAYSYINPGFNFGGGQAHNIMQPYGVSNYIIKWKNVNFSQSAITVEEMADILRPINSVYETKDANFEPSIAWGGYWIKEEITDDEIIDENFYRGQNGEIRYKKWKSGILEINIFLHDMSLTNYSSAYNGWYPFYYTLNWNNIAEIDIPPFINTNYSVVHTWTIGDGLASPGTILSKSVNQVNLYAMGSYTSSAFCQINAELKGLWKEYSAPETIYRWTRKSPKTIDFELTNHGSWVDSGTQVDGKPVYKSESSYNVNNAYDIAKITFKGYDEFQLAIRSYAESTYDYVLVSTLDNDYLATRTSSSAMRSAYNNAEYTKAYTRGKQSATNYETVTFSDLDPSTEHYFYVIYQKDSSTNSNDDRGYFYIIS